MFPGTGARQVINHAGICQGGSQGENGTAAFARMAFRFKGRQVRRFLGI